MTLLRLILLILLAWFIGVVVFLLWPSEFLGWEFEQSSRLYYWVVYLPPTVVGLSGLGHWVLSGKATRRGEILSYFHSEVRGCRKGPPTHGNGPTMLLV